jgi:amidohydrolase
MLRFDMDALPIKEETGAEYASNNQGVMHACGHDGHTAIGLTVAKILQGIKHELAGRVKFCFQPSEEGNNGQEVGGAEMMIRDDVLENPRVDMALGLHVWNEKPLGWIAASAGPVMAGAEIFKIRIVGRGGHGAIPDSAVDPIVAAAQIVTSLQTIVSRNIPPSETAVVSVTQFHAGTTFNVIPQEATLEGTIRSFEAAIRGRIVDRFEQIVTRTASAMGCQAEVEIKQLTPPVVNDPQVTEKVWIAAHRLFPASRLDASYQTMTAEDMAFFLQKVPGCFFLIGSANEEKNLNYGHHHPKFDFDEQVLVQASAILSTAVVEILQ